MGRKSGPRIERTCPNCGKRFWLLPSDSKIQFCSYRCSQDYRIKQNTPENWDQIVEEYKAGTGFKRLAKKYGIKPGFLNRRLKLAGILDTSRKDAPRWNKGMVNTDRIIMSSYMSEISELKRTDDCGHWRRHSAVSSWAAMKHWNALPKEVRQEKTRRLSIRRKSDPGYLPKVRAWKKSRLQRRPELKVRLSMGSRLAIEIKKWGKIKTSSVTKYIGCSIPFLKRHLASMWHGRMSWENYGRAWHVDHIIPCSAFDHTKEEEIAKCWNWQNLRPMWARQNLLKSDQITEPQQHLVLTFSQ